MPNEPQDVTVRRAYQIYLYAVCFVTILVVLFACADGIYSLVRIIAPGTTGAGLSGNERDVGVAGLVRNLILGGAAAAIFAFHWGKAVEARAELERALAPAEPEPEVEDPPAPKPAARRRKPPAS